ncbi:MAG TPA: MotA/TolQ/ExbB proton channel family protein, partial [Chromatiaceae bacterium]|nr:MotA/TolQ/ExbB proton channel family protein [Chromatiaceae bacterium]
MEALIEPLLRGSAFATLLERFQGFLRDGGPILTILVLVSVLATTLIALKVLQLIRLRIGARGFVGEALAL